MNVDRSLADADGEFVGDQPVLIPQGTYNLRFDDWETVLYLSRQPKVVCKFTVCAEGEWFGKPLARWYNVKAIVGKPRARGRFKVAWGQDLAREYITLVGTVSRKDGIALSRLRELLLTGVVETVTSDRKQRALHSQLQYSVLRHISLSPDVAQLRSCSHLHLHLPVIPGNGVNARY